MCEVLVALVTLHVAPQLNHCVVVHMENVCFSSSASLIWLILVEAGGFKNQRVALVFEFSSPGFTVFWDVLVKNDK